jgi:aromatic amino acid aminotransferase I
MDEHGLIPSALRAILDSTPPSPVTGRKPRVLYTIPSGQNPTGAIMPVERKREVYKVCVTKGVPVMQAECLTLAHGHIHGLYT